MRTETFLPAAHKNYPARLWHCTGGRRYYRPIWCGICWLCVTPVKSGATRRADPQALSSPWKKKHGFPFSIFQSTAFGDSSFRENGWKSPARKSGNRRRSRRRRGGSDRGGELWDVWDHRNRRQVPWFCRAREKWKSGNSSVSLNSLFWVFHFSTFYEMGRRDFCDLNRNGSRRDFCDLNRASSRCIWAVI